MTTNAIDANGNTVAPNSNLAEDNELRATHYDGNADKIAKGHYHKHVNWHSDEEMAANQDIVQRNGSRMYANGDYQSGDIINIGGMEIEYEMAVSQGLLRSTSPEQEASPQAVFESDAENTQGDDEPTNLEGADLLVAQLDLATKGNGEKVVEVFSRDAVENGEISEAGLAYAQSELGMNPQVVQEQFTAMQEHGGDVIYNALEIGDEMGEVRMGFLMDRYQHGSPSEQKAVRQLWAGAAFGKLTADQIIDAFDDIVSPYEQD
jgi:hypothetical protein